MTGRKGLGESKSRSDIVTGAYIRQLDSCLAFASLVTSCWVVFGAPPIGLALQPPQYLAAILTGKEVDHQCFLQRGQL